MDAMLKLEGGSLKGAANEVAEALVKIIEAKGEQATIQKALDTFGLTVSINGISISGCSFTNETPPPPAGGWVGDEPQQERE